MLVNGPLLCVQSVVNIYISFNVVQFLAGSTIFTVFELIHWFPRDVVILSKIKFPNTCSMSSPLHTSSSNCSHMNATEHFLMIIQHWFRQPEPMMTQINIYISFNVVQFLAGSTIFTVFDLIHWFPRDVVILSKIKFPNTCSMSSPLHTSSSNFSHMNATEHFLMIIQHWFRQPEPMMTQICVAMWHLWATISYYSLNCTSRITTK